VRLELFAGKMVRETQKSAGFDLFSHEPERVVIKPGESRMIRVGVRAEFEEGYVALFWDKSGYAGKHGICVLGGMIDGDYPKEWLCILLNTGREAFILDPGNKVTQVIFVRLAEIEEHVHPGATFERGTAARVDGFGSTGSK
jgi:dUTP pyrophosphatase